MMSALEKIAYYQNRRDEVPNQALARELAEAREASTIDEIASNLWNKNQNIRSDCLKVLYEIGYLDPVLIRGYVGDFLKLLKDKNNRMVWGAMIALGCIADRRPNEIWQQIDDVIYVLEHGSVITVLWGVRVLAKVAAKSPESHQRILPVLFTCLRTCISRDMPTHAESMLCAIDEASQVEFISILSARKLELAPAGQKRLEKVLKQLEQP
jgi:hypothetical protein